MAIMTRSVQSQELVDQALKEDDVAHVHVRANCQPESHSDAGSHPNNRGHALVKYKY